MVLAMALAGCGDDEAGGGTFSVDGHAQKGPFVNGTTITVNELDTSLVASGRVFNTTIVDDTGSFSLPGVTLDSSFARVATDGFYFDEVAGELSAARLELNMLADLSSASTVNVNLIGHLERSRVEYLIGQGSSFADAKAQAQGEVLATFGIAKTSIGASETLDVSDGSDDGAILLAISSIVQGNRTTAELTELLSAMNTDLREDGTLDSATSGTKLINSATNMDRAAVRGNIEARYENLGLVVTVGDFESHIQNFIDTTSFEFTGAIKYPASGSTGPNVLDPNVTQYTLGQASMTAEMPEDGGSLTVIMKLTSGGGPWGILAIAMSGWTADDYDFAANQQRFDVNPGTAVADLEMFLDSGLGMTGSSAGGADIEIYENGAGTPTATKSITWAP
jgi:hypothetical protein